MSDWYNNPSVEQILAEQGKKMPNGPLGFLDQLTNEDITVDHNINELWCMYLNGSLSSREFGEMAEACKNKKLKLGNAMESIDR